MKKKEAWLHLKTGVWVYIFALIPGIVLGTFLIMGQFGVIAVGGDHLGVAMLLIMILFPIGFVISLMISGWAARNAVRQVKGRR